MKKLYNLFNQNKKIFISIAQKPGKVGMNFYNPIFKKMGLSMVYKAIKPNNLSAIFNLMRNKKIEGCSISMPYKNKVYKYVDCSDKVSSQLRILNTIIYKNNKLYGYNCDYLAIKNIFRKYKIKKKNKILIYGTGSVSKIVLFFLNLNKYKKISLKGRNKTKVSKLVKEFNIKYIEPDRYDVLINCSSLGMKGMPKKLMFEKETIKKAKFILDFVNKPRNTNLIKIAKKYKLKYCDGIEISSNQLVCQFKIYTGYDLPQKYYLK